MNKFKLAQKTFKPGTLVDVKPEVLDGLIEREHQSNRDFWSWKFCALDLNGNRSPSLEFRAVRVVRLRDSDDDPMVCVCVTSDSGQSVCGWFPPDDLSVWR